MQIFVIIKAAMEKEGDRVWATTEKAFKDVGQAEAYLKTVPTAWEEHIIGAECNCERAIHSVILE